MLTLLNPSSFTRGPGTGPGGPGDLVGPLFGSSREVRVIVGAG